MPDSNDFLLSYCTNVHPSEHLDQMVASLEAFTLPLRKKLFPGQPMGLGTWMAARAAETLHRKTAELEKLKCFFEDCGFFLFTVNAFPYGDFHSRRVKEQVYFPDWTEDSRLAHTCRVADVLAELLPDGISGSISTLAGTYRPSGHNREIHIQIARNLAQAAIHLHHLEKGRGKTIQLGIEPEPWTTLELTREAIDFFNNSIYTAGAEEVRQQLGYSGEEAENLLRRHLGLCFDCCHQAVEFEHLGDSLEALRREAIPIAKMHLSCALVLGSPGENPEGIRDLLSFDEERYLHQLVARAPDGSRETLRDLDELTGNDLERWKTFDEWRCHFHVPVFLDELPHLRTTQPQLLEAIRFVRDTRYCRHLEIETYTWEVIPPQLREDLCGGTLLGSLEKEFQWAIQELGGK